MMKTDQAPTSESHMHHPTGIHHLTALAGDPQQNVAFYAGILGLPLIKRSVNFDDPSSYHLFYGAGGRQAGQVLTFLADPTFEQGEPANGRAIAASLSVPGESLDFWVHHLTAAGIDVMDPFERFGRLVIGLQDPDGLPLELVSSNGLSEPKAPSPPRMIPAQHAIRGIHGVTIAQQKAAPTRRLLSERLGFARVDDARDRSLHQSESVVGHTVECIDGARLQGEPGRGTIHHLAFAVPNEQALTKVAGTLEQDGYHLTEINDRYYFKSIFFRSPGGLLMELATPPTFTVDEANDSLGQHLSLPPALEEKRALITADLPSLDVPRA